MLKVPVHVNAEGHTSKRSKKIASYVLKEHALEAERNIVFIFQYEVRGTTPNSFPISMQRYHLISDTLKS